MLLATGRDADIFDLGDGTVLRRSRRGNSLEHEAHVMSFARARGFPVPEVLGLRDDSRSLIMEKVDGPSMLAAMLMDSDVTSHAAVLADLHLRLHDLPSPAWVRRGPGPDNDRLVHLDLHPLNVIQSERGPVVIDWANAARGTGASDVALTWTILATAQPSLDAQLKQDFDALRSSFIEEFLAHFERSALTSVLGDVIEWRLADLNVSTQERVALVALLD